MTAPLLDKYFNDTLKNNPLVYYRMREGSGTTMTDSSVNGINGTYNGSGVNWTAQSATAGTDGFAAASGKNVPLFNSYITSVDTSQNPIVFTSPFTSAFDGTAGRATATLTGINTAAASTVTVEMWVKWDGNLAGSTGAFETLANFAGTSGPLFGFLKNGTSDYRFGISARNTGDLWGLSNADTLALFTRDVYHHIVLVIVNNAIQTSQLFIDGVQKTMTQQIGTTTTTKSVTTAFALGYDSSTNFFQGSIAEVAVYNGSPYNVASALNRFHQGAYGGEHGEIATLPGLETQVEFWGDRQRNPPLVLNDKNQIGPGNRTRTLDNFYLTEIDGLDDPDLQFNEESNFYRDGMNPLISRPGGRTITFNGYVEASNFHSLRRLQSTLKQRLGSGSAASGVYTSAAGLVEQPVVLRNVWNNGFDFQINARKNSPLVMKEAQADGMPHRDFLLTMRASWPYFESSGSRTEILIVGATLAIPTKGTFSSFPVINFWGPFYDARLVLNNTLIIQATTAASTFIQVDCKNRTCTNWPAFNPVSDFPFLQGALQADSFVNYAQFISVAGATLGVTRVEITWKHSMI